MQSVVRFHRIEFRHSGLDFGDTSGIHTPWFIHTDLCVEIPKHALFTGFRDQSPCDDGSAKLLVGPIDAAILRCSTLGMVVEKPAIRVLAKRRISGCAKD